MTCEEAQERLRRLTRQNDDLRPRLEEKEVEAIRLGRMARHNHQMRRQLDEESTEGSRLRKLTRQNDELRATLRKVRQMLRDDVRQEDILVNMFGGAMKAE